MYEPTAQSTPNTLAAPDFLATELHQNIGLAVAHYSPVRVSRSFSDGEECITGLPSYEDMLVDDPGLSGIAASQELLAQETSAAKDAAASTALLQTSIAKWLSNETGQPEPLQATSSLWQSATFTNAEGHNVTVVRTALYSFNYEYASRTEITVRDEELIRSTAVTMLEETPIDIDATTLPTELYETAQGLLGDGPNLSALTSLMQGTCPGEEDAQTLLYMMYRDYQHDPEVSDVIGMLLGNVRDAYYAALETRELEQMMGENGNPGLSLGALMDLNASVVAAV